MRNRAGLLLAATAVLVSNGAALLHVRSNRAAAEAEVVLTERELPREVQEQDDTGVSLRLDWGFRSGMRLEDWLNRAKLRELGFDTTAEPGDGRYDSAPARLVFVALEYDGPAWRKYLSDYDDWTKRWMYSSSPAIAQEQAEQVRNSAGRLIPIDAAQGAATLRARHPDASRILIVGAKIHVTYVDSGAARQVLTGRLEPLIRQVHVPRPVSRQFAASPPRYLVHLRFGAHREPWVESIALPR
jgi:hypothetical protein